MGKPIRVLIIDNAGYDILPIMETIKKGGYDPTHERVATGETIRRALEDDSWDLVLCDYHYAVSQSFSAVSILKDMNIDIPFIVTSNVEGEEAAVQAMKAGASDFVVKAKLSRLVPAIDEALKESTDRMPHQEQNIELLRRGLEATIQTISSAVEIRDPYTAGHQRRVSHLACAIAAEMGLPPRQIDGLRTASAIHDIGKLSIPSEILSKPAKLTEAEYNLIKKHPKAGYDILKDIDFPWPVARMVLEHHERIDGSGYPNHLTKDNLLLESMILAVSDVVEAVASFRSYRPAQAVDVALDEIVGKKGIHYNDQVVDACIKLFGLKGYKIIP
jgi:HD-GYP domain-containing protein (c-di-GMP phosphodiesterase class II)